jgi:quinol monooxygenase YgiN
MVAQLVRMTLDWTVTPGEVTAINAALNSLMVATRVVPGCLGCTLSTRLGEQAGFHYVEEWQSEGDLINQLRSNRFTKLADLLERANRRPHVEFVVRGETRGIDYAEEVRGQQGETP